MAEFSLLNCLTLLSPASLYKIVLIEWQFCVFAIGDLWVDHSIVTQSRRFHKVYQGKVYDYLHVHAVAAVC